LIFKEILGYLLSALLAKLRASWYFDVQNVSLQNLLLFWAKVTVTCWIRRRFSWLLVPFRDTLQLSIDCNLTRLRETIQMPS
jgi:hypothetical protein